MACCAALPVAASPLRLRTRVVVQRLVVGPQKRIAAVQEIEESLCIPEWGWGMVGGGGSTPSCSLLGMRRRRRRWRRRGRLQRPTFAETPATCVCKLRVFTMLPALQAAGT